MKRWHRGYDNFIRKICPDYEKSLDTVVKNIPKNAERIVELGCGTGNLTLKISRRYPQKEITAIEIDRRIIEAAKFKLRRKNVKIVNKNVCEIDFEEFDLVVSSLMLHSLKDIERRRLLKSILSSSIKEFIIFDRVKGKTRNEEDKFHDYFIKNLQKQNILPIVVSELLKENQKNNPMKLNEIEKLFNSCNFRLEILFRNLQHAFVVYRGVRHD